MKILSTNRYTNPPHRNFNEISRLFTKGLQRYIIFLREQNIFTFYFHYRNKKTINYLRFVFIFEDRFLLEEGVYWRYMTDEKRKIDRKGRQR